MASSRKPSKSESSSKPSSGSNSKRNSISGNPVDLASSGNGSKRNSLNSSSTSSIKEEILNLGTTDNVDAAEENTRKFIMNEMKEPQGTWVSHWGSKLTDSVKTGEGIANLGRVIGKDFIADTSSSNKVQKVENSSYRIDWEKSREDLKKPKGSHYNAVVVTKVKNRYIAYPFGDLEKDSQIDSRTNKALGELTMINKMLALTASAIEKNELMQPELAQRILKNFENPSPHIKQHFKEFGSLLREVIIKAHDVILQSGKANTEEAYKFDRFKLLDRVAEYLADIWEPVLTNQLDAILSGSGPKSRLNPENQLLLSECIYAASDMPFSDKVLDQFSHFLSRIERDQDVDTFVNYLKDLSEQVDPMIEKFHKKVMELRNPMSQELQDNKPEESKKPLSSTSSAMLAMMSSGSQVTQALRQTLQAAPTISEPTKPKLGTSSVSRVSSSLEKVTIDEKAVDNSATKNTYRPG
jgi:hypothetical protein